MTFFESSSRSISWIEHGLFRKPVSIPDQVRGRPFRDHAFLFGVRSNRMPGLLTILVQFLVAGSLSAAAAGFWVWQALTWKKSLNWFDRIAERGLSDLALIVLLGAAVALTVRLCGQYLDHQSGDRVAPSRGGPWLVAGLAVVGMLALHVLVMSSLPRQFVPGQAIRVSAVLQAWPWLPVVALVPLGAALLGYWMSATKLVILLQIA